jgi:hypothetical protein
MMHGRGVGSLPACVADSVVRLALVVSCLAGGTVRCTCRVRETQEALVPRVFSDLRARIFEGFQDDRGRDGVIYRHASTLQATCHPTCGHFT